MFSSTLLSEDCWCACYSRVRPDVIPETHGKLPLSDFELFSGVEVVLNGRTDEILKMVAERTAIFPRKKKTSLGAARKGYIQDLWRRQPLTRTWGFHPGPKDADVFVCGNAEMAESMSEVLAKEGFQEHTRQQPGTVDVERYW